MTVSPIAIEARDVSYAYRAGAEVLSGLSLRLEPGVTLLLGPNGSGKSTLLRLLAGVEPPDRGSIRIGGYDLWREEAASRRLLAYVPEIPDLPAQAGVREVLEVVARLRRRAGESPLGERIGAELDRAGLAGLAGRGSRELSLGQRRRLLLAAARLADPPVLLLDEPFESLDLAARRDLADWLRAGRAEGRTIVIVSHEIELVEPLCDRVAVATAGWRLEELPVEGRVDFLADRAVRRSP